MNLQAGLGLAALLLLITPAGHAQRGLVFGMEDMPELWGDGTVEYNPATPRPHDHDYVAINRSWLDVDDAGELLQLHLRVVDTGNLEANQANWWISCRMDALITTEGEPSGRAVAWTFRLATGADSNETWVYNRDSAYVQVGASGTQEIVPVANTFSITVGEPGYYTWAVSRADLRKYGTELTNLEGLCDEQFAYGGGSVTPFWKNTDSAASKSVYSMEEGRRLAGPDGALDPIEEFERMNTSAPPALTSSEAGNGTSFLPVSVVLLAIAATILVRGRHP